MKKAIWQMVLAITILASAFPMQAQPARITVDVAHPSHKISPMLWGIFFEDINHSADGGIYPELVRNRSFEDSDQPQFWKLTDSPTGTSTMSVDSLHPLNSFNRHYLRLNANGGFTLENDGYWGMNIIRGDGYTLRFAARADGFAGALRVRLVGTNGTELAQGEVSGFTSGWKHYTLHLSAAAGDPRARLLISGNSHGALDLDMVSLMPDKTWKGHGLRVDLCQALNALHPSFMRFPGGNFIEGNDVADMYHWKNTIGNIDARTPDTNPWGYQTTAGLGFYEYLQLCQDLGAKPVFAINCGMSLNGHVVPMSRMGQWVQDALDAIQYANGPTNSVWGSQRAQAGHPAPFNLRYMEIGNENGGPAYWKRWKLMADAIRAKYPYMKLIMTTSLSGYSYPPTPKPNIVDEHYYESARAFMKRAHQYDHYNRQGPKIFVGEYAVTQNAGEGNLRAAIGEAAFMTGMERNSDIVKMASYAPLFANVNHRNWSPDLINFDSSSWYGTPSYYVQKMFSNNRGDMELPVQVESPRAVFPASKGMIGVGTWNTAAEFKDIKVTAPDGKVLFQSDFSQNAKGWKLLGNGAQWSVHEGMLRQTAQKTFIRALAGDKSWTNYTLTLKARKLGGREGFLILFHIANDHGRTWWNIGGWNNTRDAIENGGIHDSKPRHIATGRWYDLRLQVQGNRVKCWLDGRLDHDVKYESGGNLAALYACASWDDQRGEVIVKVVNGSSQPVETQLDLKGAKDLTGKGSAIVLTSANPWDENSLNDPTNVVPRSEAVSFVGANLTRLFPADSFTVLRLKTSN